MHPYLVQSENFTVGAYPFFYGLALVAGCLVLGLLLRSSQVSFRTSVHFWSIVAVMVVIGGRLLFALIERTTAFAGGVTFINFESGGEVLYGALTMGVVTAWLLARRWRMPLSAVFDAAAVAAPVGIAIGRIGCLLQGCCHGKICDADAWFGLRYPKQIDSAGNVVGSLAYLEQLQLGIVHRWEMYSAPVYPVPIFESVVCLIVAGAMFVLWRRQPLKGRLFALMVALYCVWRFCAEFIRVHERNWWGLTVYQVISLAFGGLAVAVFARCWRQKAESGTGEGDLGPRRDKSESTLVAGGSRQPGTNRRRSGKKVRKRREGRA